MTAANENGLTPREGQPVKSLTSYAADFIAVCIRFASWDAAILSAALLLALDSIRLLALGILQ